MSKDEKSVIFCGRFQEINAVFNLLINLYIVSVCARLILCHLNYFIKDLKHCNFALVVLATVPHGFNLSTSKSNF